ncbi:hypothetical protein V6N11_077375 [Hibiscus sabdariffa]|uniref:Uncharacterized protein n=1 Tax=Hibiscus sabdariffa TaxID=183260 RepID=A0ABR2TDT0_9ROSI
MVEDFHATVGAGNNIVRNSAVIQRAAVRWEAPPVQCWGFVLAWKLSYGKSMRVCFVLGLLESLILFWNRIVRMRYKFLEKLSP